MCVPASALRKLKEIGSLTDSFKCLKMQVYYNNFYNMSAHVDVDFFKAGGGGARMVFWIV